MILICNHLGVCVKHTAAKEFPPIKEQLIGAAKAAKDTLRSFIRGEPVTVSKEEQTRRQDICNTCEYFRGGRCLQCGCVTALKTRLQVSHCPVAKW